jgi:hypothetical protein
MVLFGCQFKGFIYTLKVSSSANFPTRPHSQANNLAIILSNRTTQCFVSRPWCGLLCQLLSLFTDPTTHARIVRLKVSAITMLDERETIPNVATYNSHRSSNLFRQV